MIPAGWDVVTFAASRSNACPPGFASASPQDVNEGPDASSACSCACSVQTPPTCEVGSIAVHFDVAQGGQVGQCGTQGQPASMNNTPAGGCDTDLYKGGNGGPFPSYKDLDLEFTPPGLTPGKCTGAGQATGTVSFAAQDRVCTADGNTSGNCTGNQCTPNVPSPYLFCIAKSGAQACPAGSFSQQHLVGTTASFTCASSACTCSFPPATCSGGTVALFTDGQCTQGELDLPVDGACHASGAKSDTYGSYKYTANAPSSTSCASGGTSAPQNVTLASEQTICCL